MIAAGEKGTMSLQAEARAGHDGRRGAPPVRWARVALTFLVLATLHLGVVRAAFGMQCVRTSGVAAMSADASIADASLSVERPGDAPPLSMAAGCGTTAWVPGAGPAIPALWPASAPVPTAAPRSGPEVPPTPPFHPPRPI